MILRHHRVPCTANDVRRQLGAGRNGCTAAHLLQAARHFGLSASGHRVSAEGLASVPVPCILHWRRGHFVVLEKVLRDHFHVCDPASGRHRMSISDCEREYSGCALLFSTPKNAHWLKSPSRQSLSLMRGPAMGLLKATVLSSGNVRRLLVLALCTCVIYGTSLVFPILTKTLVDDPAILGENNIFLRLIVALLGLCVAQFAFSWLRSATVMVLRQSIDRSLAHEFFRHALALQPSFFQTRASGDILARANSLLAIRELVSTTLLIGLVDVVCLVVYVAMLSWMARWYCVWVLLLGGTYIGILFLRQVELRNWTMEEVNAQTNETSYLMQALRGIQTVKALTAEGAVLRRWLSLFETRQQLSARRDMYLSKLESLLGLIRKHNGLMLLYFCLPALMAHELTVGSALALSTMGSYVIGPLTSVATMIQQAQLASIHLERIDEVLTEPAEVKLQERSSTSEEFPPRIMVNNVSYRYSRSEPDVLIDISFDVHPGDRLAIVGRSGSGKSTLGLLLGSLLTPDSGSVSVIGADGTPLTGSNHRHSCAVVLQDSILFEGTIRDNLCLGVGSVRLEELREATAAAGILDEIDAVSRGFDSYLGDNGFGLSGGQRQRLAIARALLRKPKILILDEATSNLDSITERAVLEALIGLGCTIVMISHNPQSVALCERVAYLAEGRLQAVGSHRELYEQLANYRELF